MNTSIIDRALTKQAPHSPRERIAGFAIASRAVDKCRASLTGKLGEYHYDCPLDNMLFSFKGINGGQFKAAVQASKNYEDVGVWYCLSDAQVGENLPAATGSLVVFTITAGTAFVGIDSALARLMAIKNGATRMTVGAVICGQR